MNKRINTILKYIDESDKVLDIGCDQALLGIELAKKSIYSYAGDIKENIVLNAKEKTKIIKLDKYITFKTSDGLKEFINDDIDTLVIAGMGTYTILDILKNSKKYKKIITISNNDHYLLRTEMIKYGYKIKFEEIIYEKNKYYNLIIFIPGKEKYTEKELYFGYNHQNIELLNKRNKYLLEKYNKLPKKGKNKLKNIIEMLEN